MAEAGLLLVVQFFFTLSILVWMTSASYVVYMGAHSHDPRDVSVDFEKVTDSHHEFLGSFLGSKEKAKEAIFYSYIKSINGFAAVLEEEVANEISKHPDVVSVFLDQRKKLHTTRSWEFLGLERDGRVLKSSLMRQARFGQGVIIANVDTGVWSDSKSFSDHGMGPIPSRWRGTCQTDTENPVKCNRKLIGAQMFYKGYEAWQGHPLNKSDRTPRDMEGHGSHTLSTAAGRFVHASIYGQANGTAKGGSPMAYVAAYKVCWADFCLDSDVMAAIDWAIHDGVDVLSISLGGYPSDYLSDGIAIGSFHAVSHGINVICSGGNAGPVAGSISNVAPWIFTVGASTIDRKFVSYAHIGNKKKLQGESLSQKSLPKRFYALIDGMQAVAANSTQGDALLCMKGSLDPKKVKGKIVLCLRGISARVEKGEVVLKAGGAGMILFNDEISKDETVADAHVLPATHISFNDGFDIFTYINSTISPVAYISHPETLLNTKPAPFMASFSSRGPNMVTQEILKPDITAPGVSILAAYSEAVSPTSLPSDNRRVPFNVESGTSMSCPHVAGIVGLLRGLHPTWSPAAIRSAIMTSARTRDNEEETIDDADFHVANPFGYGAGHVRPNRALDPGLVYDLTTTDYLNFLCSLNYSKAQIGVFYNKTFSCPSKALSLVDFNYPAITVPHLTGPTTLTRKVKNVGAPGTYKVKLTTPRGVSMQVEPVSLAFKKTGEEKVFKVRLVPKRPLGSDYVFGRIVWSDGVHYVRSPVAVSGNGA